MIHLPFPLPPYTLYTVLGATALALLWATAVNKWSLKVFFLLALRLAIGWHFLFEGVHKIHSHYIGASETSRPFSSEMYFTLGEGPAAAEMRKRLGDPAGQLNAKLSDEKVSAELKKIAPNARLGRGPGGDTPEEYTRMVADPETAVRDMDRFAKMVPPAVEKDWADFVAAFADKYKLSEAEKKKIDGKLDDDEKAQLVAVRKAADTKDKAERKALADKAGKLPGDLGTEALAAYGRWVAGVEGREAKVKYVSGQDPQWSAPQRREYIDHRKADLDALQKRSDSGLGHGYGLDQKKITELKQLVTTAEKDLLADADGYLTDLKKRVVSDILSARFDAKAAGPYKSLLGDGDPLPAEKLTALFPQEKAPEKPTFDDLPTELRKVWDNYEKEFKAAYPLEKEQSDEVDRVYHLMQARLANWYFDRNEYSGQPTPGKGFAGQAKKYRDAQERAKATAERLKALPPPPAAAPKEKEEPKADAAAAGFAGVLARSQKSDGNGAAAGPGFVYSLTRASVVAAADQAKKDAAAAPDVAVAALEAKFTDLKTALSKALPADVAAGPVTVKPDKSFIERLDTITMWSITAIGAMLLLGLFTRLAAFAGAAFLVMTYLTHPPFPWLPLPPGTEGNPVFINKNVIEALALLVIMVHATGRWLGIDALLHRIFFRNSPEYLGPPKRVRAKPAATPPAKPVTGRV
jgi:uncharacterized membrane protein YphA (DoxX/SURF4 family)